MRLALSLLLVAAGVGRTAEPRYADRWVYCQHNLLVDQNVEDLLKILDRAAKAGYTGLVLADYKFNILDRMPERYVQNVERVKKAAADRNIELIPCVFPIGYSDGLLVHDPNLAEGVPVKDAPFVAKGKELVPAGEPVTFVNGGFEQARGDTFAGCSFQDEPGKSTFADKEVMHGGAMSLRMQDPAGNCRINQKVKLRPWTCYRYATWVKTKDLKRASFKLMALGGTGRALTFHEAHLKPDQDWTQMEVVFNTLGETDAAMYVGAWGGFKGTIWVDDLTLEELSLVNVLRRDGCPLSVTSADGKTVYEEGKDFQPVKDPVMLKNAAAGRWEFGHKGPTIELTAGSRIKDGDRLKVSWYHPVLVHGEQVACSLLAPKVFDLLKDQAKRVNDLLHPKTFFMQHDEIRVAGWDETGMKSGLTPGGQLAENARRCREILREVNPAARVVVWSDMFDPHHNAVDNYYLVNGSWKGSWDGLAKDVVIANWNGGKAADSLKFFTDRGHPQVIAGYYDGDLSNFKRWDTAAKGVSGVRGFMYTTWARRYGLLEAYGKAISGTD
jgi:hypothetical protein